MRSNFAIAVIAAVVSSVGVVTVASADSRSSGGNHGAKVVKVFERSVVDEFIDVGGTKMGPSVGDEAVFSGDLFRQKSGGSKVGTDGGSCTIVRVKSHSAVGHCSVTASFSNGQITAQGLVEFLNRRQPPFDLAVVGGTGAFEGAGGHVNVKELSDTVTQLTFFVRHADARR